MIDYVGNGCELSKEEKHNIIDMLRMQLKNDEQYMLLVYSLTLKKDDKERENISKYNLLADIPISYKRFRDETNLRNNEHDFYKSEAMD